MKNLFFKAFLFIIMVLFFQSCFVNRKDWRDKYFAQTKKIDIKTKKWLRIRADKEIINTYFEYKFYNGKNQLICVDSTSFYIYDSTGRLIQKESLDVRYPKSPNITKYFYDDKGRLSKEISYSNSDESKIKYYYDDKSRLYRESFQLSSKDEEKTRQLFLYNDGDIINENARCEYPYSYMELFSFDDKSRLICKIVKSHDEAEKKECIHTDSLFYDDNNKVVLKKSWESDKDLLHLTRYTYDDTLVVSEKDTTITFLNLLHWRPDMVLSSFYCFKEKKYDSKGRLIKEIIYCADYKTIFETFIYEYKTELLK